MTRFSQETFLYLCTDNFVITIIYSPMLGKAHELEELLQVQHRPMLKHTQIIFSGIMSVYTILYYDK